MNRGDKVIFQGEIKMLNRGSIGVLDSINDDWGVVIYPQNKAYESDGNGGWRLIKGAPNQIYAHSVRLSEIKLETLNK